MLGGLRSLFYQISLRWPPLEGLSVTKEAIRGLYNKMFEPGGYHYENLDLQGETPILSTRHRSGRSSCKFGPDFITIEEEKPQMGIDDFVGVVTTVLGGLDQDDVPSFFIQTCKIQLIAQPSNAKHSLELLAKRLARVYGAIEPFERPPAFFGVRFRFAPVEPGDEEHLATSEKEDAKTAGVEETQISHASGERAKRIEGYVTARFETYSEDIRQVWMEASASYPQIERTLLLRDVQAIGDKIKETYSFLVDKSKRFLDQFDTETPPNES